MLRGKPVAVTNATEGWPATHTLTRSAFLENYGDATWQPQYLLPGSATTLAPYLRRAAAGEEQRPLSFNRPTDLPTFRRLQAEVRAHQVSQLTAGQQIVRGGSCAITPSRPGQNLSRSSVFN